MVSAADANNSDLIISEFGEYCNDIDQDCVRRAVKAIGQVVCKVERVAKRGVEALKEHINHEGGSESALQEAVVVASKIFRKYPRKFEGLIKDICAQMKRIDEPESKAAFIWILGEFAEKIDSVENMLQYFVDSFSDESTHVCLQILTAAVKMYIKKSDECEEMVMNVLHLASEESDNPDLRDRGYIYWRMLSTDPTATKDVVLIKRPEYTQSLGVMMDDETREIFTDIGIKKKVAVITEENPPAAQGDEEEVEDEDAEEEQDSPDEKSPPKKTKKEKEKGSKKKNGKDKKEKKGKKSKDKEQVENFNIKEPDVDEDGEETISTQKHQVDLDDLLGLGGPSEPVSSGETAGISDPLADIFSTGPSNGVSDPVADWATGDFFGGSASSGAAGVTAASKFVKGEMKEVLSSATPGQNKNTGLRVTGLFYREDAKVKLDLEFSNSSSSMLTEFAVQFNKNSFGITPGALNVVPISAGSSFKATME
jgi:hypothetical protein